LFKATVLAQKSLFGQAALASLLANSLAIAASIYSMQVYDRVIPTQGISTLIVLTTGRTMPMSWLTTATPTRSGTTPRWRHSY